MDLRPQTLIDKRLEAKLKQNFLNEYYDTIQQLIGDHAHPVETMEDLKFARGKLFVWKKALEFLGADVMVSVTGQEVKE